MDNSLAGFKDDILPLFKAAYAGKVGHRANESDDI
jgi:hypothetical protein